MILSFKIFLLVPEIAIKNYNTIQYDVGHPVDLGIKSYKKIQPIYRNTL